MSEGQPAPAAAADASRWVDEHGDALSRYALGRVGRADVAEDLVQETFLAALRVAGTFAGRASERTWLTGILKNKLIDRLRREGRSRPATDLGAPDDWLDGLYDATGHWRAPPGAWGADPSALLERREFWEAFERCRAGLPDRLREVLSLRLLDGVPAADLCAALGITANNLWTLLHRARVRLWQCLDRQGLGPLAGGGKP
jgi:RNA polymerase sigma-70 factor (TIGR02943 family)